MMVEISTNKIANDATRRDFTKIKDFEVIIPICNLESLWKILTVHSLKETEQWVCWWCIRCVTCVAAGDAAQWKWNNGAICLIVFL